MPFLSLCLFLLQCAIALGGLGTGLGVWAFWAQAAPSGLQVLGFGIFQGLLAISAFFLLDSPRRRFLPGNALLLGAFGLSWHNSAQQLFSCPFLGLASIMGLLAWKSLASDEA